MGTEINVAKVVLLRCLNSSWAVLIGLSIIVTDWGMAANRGGGLSSPRITQGNARRIVGSNGVWMRDGVVIAKLNLPQTIYKGGILTGVSSLDKQLQTYQVYALERAHPLPTRTARSKDLELNKVYHLWYSNGEDPREVARRISDDPNVEYAVPWYIHKIHEVEQASTELASWKTAEVPNDSLYPFMTHLSHIQLPSAWDVVKGEDSTVVIAIVDGGTDWKHKDLLENVWENLGEDADGDGHTLEYQGGLRVFDPDDLNGIDDDDWDDDPNTFVDDLIGWNFPYDSGDPAGLLTAPLNAEHGTGTAGAASAVTGNSIGIAGASWNAKLMLINATCENDSFICDGYDGVLYAAASGADIINASWGSTHTDLTISEERRLLRYVQDIMDAVRASGALLVSSAGNESVNNDNVLSLPSGAPHVLAVGATGKTTDVRAGYSNYGLSVDVFAPGDGINVTRPNNRYDANASGTSYSSPLAAGIAALVKTQYPAMTPDQVLQQVRVTAVPIDYANPGFQGLLGRGRVDAQRAVSEITSPAIRLVNVVYNDADGDGAIESGELADLTVEVTNYLADAANVTFALAEDDPNIEVISSSAFLTTLLSGDTTGIEFQISVGTVSEQYPLRFVLEIDDGTYRDKDRFKLYANEPPFLTHDTGALRVSITAQGNIGWTGFAEQTTGEGFIYRGNNLLFEGGLLVATSRNKVSDCIRGEAEVLERDFAIPLGEQMVIVEGELAYEQGYVVLGDHEASSPIGVTIYQESYADTSSDYDDFAIFRYVITNTSGRNLSNLYTGLFFDWDINEDNDFRDFANYDWARMMGIMQNRLTSPSILAATRVLTQHANPMFRAISNPAEIYGGETGDGFTADEKWDFLSGGIQTLTQSSLDASTLSGTGPFSLAANESAEIAYAVIGAGSLSELQENADNAQEYWDSIISPSYSNHSPLFTKGLSDTAITTDETLIFTYVAEDPEEDDLTFSLMSPPRNASIDPVSGTMTYLSDDNFGGDQKTETITVVVSDGEFVGTTNTSITTEKLGDLLSQSYANPLSLSKHEETRIDYHLAKEGKVSLVVYDILGREVKTLVNDTKPEGKYSAFWNAHDNQGRRVSTGIYLYRIQAGDFIETRKIVVLK